MEIAKRDRWVDFNHGVIMNHRLDPVAYERPIDYLRYIFKQELRINANELSYVEELRRLLSFLNVHSRIIPCGTKYHSLILNTTQLKELLSLEAESDTTRGWISLEEQDSEGNFTTRFSI